jgi:hypothetical protein
MNSVFFLYFPGKIGAGAKELLTEKVQLPSEQYIEISEAIAV